MRYSAGPQQTRSAEGPDLGVDALELAKQLEVGIRIVGGQQVALDLPQLRACSNAKSHKGDEVKQRIET